LCELHNGLRPEIDPELCGNYAALYNFCIRKLHEANLHHRPEPLDEAVQILQHLRETWVMVIEQIAQERAVLAQQAAPAHEPIALGRPGALLAVHS
jgi:flagellin-specific chaperone FliS